MREVHVQLAVAADGDLLKVLLVSLPDEALEVPGLHERLEGLRGVVEEGGVHLEGRLQGVEGRVRVGTVQLLVFII